MTVSTLEGIVVNGRIRIRNSVVLPENARVFVVIPDFEDMPQRHVYSPRLSHPKQIADFEKEIVKVPTDAGL